MSAPDTNTEKQAKAHRGPLRLGIALPVLFALSLLAILIVAVFLRGNDPEGAETQVEPGVGTEEAGVVATE